MVKIHAQRLSVLIAIRDWGIRSANNRNQLFIPEKLSQSGLWTWDGTKKIQTGYKAIACVLLDNHHELCHQEMTLQMKLGYFMLHIHCSVMNGIDEAV